MAEGDREDARRAIAAANAAFPSWGRAPASSAPSSCTAWPTPASAARDELARILTLDQGKPLKAEAEGEVGELIEFFRMAAEDGKRVQGIDPRERRAGPARAAAARPLGVLGSDHPLELALHDARRVLAPALACGNCVVWTPAPSTAVCSGVLAECVAEADLPPGVFNFVLGPGPEVGDELAVNPGTRAVAFTGSTATGLIVARQAAGKAQLLEMGGNGPFVVMEDADLAAAAEAARVGSFLGAGQSCSAAERLLVHEAVREEFVDAAGRRGRARGRGSATRSTRRHDGPGQQRARRGQDGRARERRRGARRHGGHRAAAAPTASRPACTGSRRCSTTSRRLDRGHPGDLRPDRPVVGICSLEEAIEQTNAPDLRADGRDLHRRPRGRHALRGLGAHGAREHQRDHQLLGGRTSPGAAARARRAASAGWAGAIRWTR